MPILAIKTADTFQLGTEYYPRGEYVPVFKRKKGVMNFGITYASNPNAYLKNLTPYTKFTQANGTAYASYDAFATAAATALSQAQYTPA